MQIQYIGPNNPQASIHTDVCIFCTTRLQFASSRPSLQLQKRLFWSSAPLKRPPASAAAQQIEYDEEQPTYDSWSDIRQESSRRDDGWGFRAERRLSRREGIKETESAIKSLPGQGNESPSVSPFRPLQHEAFRPNLSSFNRRTGTGSADAEHERRVFQHDLNLNNGTYRPDWLCMDCGRKNFSKTQYCYSCDMPGPDRRDWQCQQCKTTHDGSIGQCRKCNQRPVLSGKKEESVPSHHWRHLRRSTSKMSFKPVKATALESPQANQEIQETFAKARAAEAERAKRWSDAERGGYVGFRKRDTRGPSKPSKIPPIPKSLLRPEEALTSEASPVPLDADIVGDIDPALSFDPSFLEDDHQKPRQRRLGVNKYEGRNAPHDKNRHKARRSGFRRAQEEFEEDIDDSIARKQERREQRKKAKEEKKLAGPPIQLHLPEFISVVNLAPILKVRVEDFLGKMEELGFDGLNNDHVLDAETAGLIAAEFNFEAIIDHKEEQDLKPRPPAEDRTKLPTRPPVVTIMGHVDHGKTTLLDYLRKSSVAASEHGGITQHIGAFSVPMPGGKLVTFLDTPGHEAFLAMRQRGANVTDIVILVVAADDSVKPQTIEAIKHAQSAKVPMIVAINKVDKEDSNIERVKQDLARYSVEMEDFGGETQVVCVSGKTGQGMKELEDAAVALADIIDMRAERDGEAEGWVLEATTKKAGRVATVLIRRGTLHPGDIIVAGTSWAKVRCLRNEAGAVVSQAGPGTPIEIDGWREQPSAGDEMLQAPDEQKAKSVIEYRLEALGRSQLAVDVAAVNKSRRIEQEKREQLEKTPAVATPTTENISASTDTGLTDAETESEKLSLQEVFFVLKADVSGSLEAVTNAVSALGSSEVQPRILRSGVGPITEFDIDHAAVAKGHIISFNTVVDGSIRRMAEDKNVRIIDQSIIYRLVDDVKTVLEEKLPDEVSQKVTGEAEVAQVFHINVKGRMTMPIAGCRVRNGLVSKSSKIRVLREKEVVYDGKLNTSATARFGLWRY